MKFEFSSDHFSSEGFCHNHEIEISLISQNEDECYFEIESIWDLDGNVERKLEDFPEDEQLKIERKAQKLCDENAHEAWIEKMVMKAEFERDSREGR